MAKSRPKNRSRYSKPTQARRDLYIVKPRIAKPRLPRRLLLSSLVSSSTEDFRRYHPNVSFRKFRDLSGGVVRPRHLIGVVPRRSPFLRRVVFRRARSDSLNVVSTLPRSAVICARRKIRKEVIFAKGKAGRGGQRSPRRNARSSVVCV